jgi:hypothetical protein
MLILLDRFLFIDLKLFLNTLLEASKSIVILIDPLWTRLLARKVDISVNPDQPITSKNILEYLS